MCFDVRQVYVYLRCSWYRKDCHGARGDEVSAAGGRTGGDPTVPLRRDQRHEDDRPTPGVCPDSAGLSCAYISSIIPPPLLIFVSPA